MVLFRLTYLRW